jgi:hypothetical protein
MSTSKGQAAAEHSRDGATRSHAPGSIRDGIRASLRRIACGSSRVSSQPVGSNADLGQPI